MVTRNWYNAFKALRSKTLIPNGFTFASGAKTKAGYLATSSGSVTNQTWLSLRNSNISFSTSTYGIMVGSGSTPATLDDYMLENLIASGLSISVAEAVDDDNDGVYKLTITNTSNQDITIGEIGMWLQLYTGNNTNNSGAFLVERTVLDNPITIPAGGIGLIEYAIKLPIPEA